MVNKYVCEWIVFVMKFVLKCIRKYFLWKNISHEKVHVFSANFFFL